MVPFRLRHSVVLAALLLAIAGCSQFPAEGPTPGEFAGHPDASAGFLIVDLDARTASVLARAPQPTLARQFTQDTYIPDLRLRPGEAVTVALFDYGASPLFGAPDSAGQGDLGAGAIVGGAHQTSLPAQLIDRDGTIAIPFGGHVRVAGLTPVQAGARIASALAGRATTPQAVVSLSGPSLVTASVGGDVGQPQLLPLTLRGERILDAIAAAGGARYEPADSSVRLIRAGQSAQASLQHILDTPGDNLLLEPGDELFVTHEPRTFLVLGAALKVSQYDFNTRTVSLAEAVARAGGPNDELADSAHLYLLRIEDPTTVRTLLGTGSPSTTGPTPVAYRIDLRHGPGYFLAQQLPMRDKDLVLMTNANSVELRKVFDVVRNLDFVRYSAYSHI
jgi:polysaccharide export outer membrane protein